MPAPPGTVWHHIVEQCREKVFGTEMIQNSANVVALSPEINNRLNALYSSIKPWITGSTTLTVRQWLSTQSFEKQYIFGLKAIEMVSKGLW